MKARLYRWLRAPRGCDVRRLAGWATLAVAIPRLPVWPGPTAIFNYPLGILPQETFGWLFLAAGLLLLATGGEYRSRVRGRLAALLALLAWSVLAAATPSMTSRLIDLVFMYSLVGEIIAGRDDPC